MENLILFQVYDEKSLYILTTTKCSIFLKANSDKNRHQKSSMQSSMFYCY